MRQQIAARPHKEAGSRPGVAAPSKKTDNENSIQPSVATAKQHHSLYVYAGDHPNGFEIFTHPLQGLVRFAEGRPRGLSTDELDALEYYEEEQARMDAEDWLDDISKGHEASVVMF